MTQVLSFAQASQLFDHAKKSHLAFPAVNVVDTNTINACLTAASVVNSPIIIQVSHGGSNFFIGSPDQKDTHRGSILGATAAAKYIHAASALHNIPVMINTDHASKKLIPWIDGLLKHGEDFFRSEGVPLFTSHMLDLSELPLHENIEICKRYLERLTKLNMYLEIELGITGGEEDGVDNSHVDVTKLYTQPEDVEYAYEELRKISNNFIVAASFGNVHGVYKPGNVKLEPKILRDCQRLVTETSGGSNPVSFVFHGGSGSTIEEIHETLNYGIVKMNLDTDMQWAFWNGVRVYYQNNREFLQSQLGNTLAADAPNKKYYDPRKWLQQAVASFGERLKVAYTDLNCINVCEHFKESVAV